MQNTFQIFISLLDSLWNSIKLTRKHCFVDLEINLQLCQVVLVVPGLPEVQLESGRWWDIPECTWLGWRGRTGRAGPWPHPYRAARPAHLSDQDPERPKLQSYTLIYLFYHKNRITSFTTMNCISKTFCSKEVQSLCFPLHADLTHRWTLDSFWSCSTFTTWVTDWTSVSSGPWDAGWSDGAWRAGSTHGAFWSSL